ncbi:cytochrome P450 2J4-like isoform X3 [Peromyscus maniculatus bairdii]|uniref:cytochrome P450 2J4-like isoform X3 n=1 Tax=Peromyscus maniculatus bairdii TaxID=230844 RepID=UPI001C2ED626|nr:cytochrome P450 2J4-like isoform X3 [Peromyscus maniculatus bairdii]
MLITDGSLVAAIWAALHPRTLLLTAVTFLFLTNYLKNRRPKNHPPGPWRLPFVGNLFQLDLEQTHLVIQQFVKKYGNLISLDFGNIPSVVVTGLPLIKEAFTQMEQNFLKRPITPLRERVFKNNGLIMSNGQTWKEQRRFALMTLKNFGLGKKSLEQLIQEEALHLADAIGEEEVFRNWEKLKLFVSRMMDSHRKDWNPVEPRDFIDSFLTEMAKHPDKTTSFNEENLICSTLDLFFAGTETTSTTLRWALLYMSVDSEVQEKVQAEIDRVIGHGRQPSTADRESMPYTNAVIHEVQRMGNIIPLNVPREVTADSTLAGFHLPKGTMVLTNLTALHRDPKEWATPDIFNPEHFLENGLFKKRESFLPFSMGKRACLGEQLARTELFIFFTVLMQKFTFKPPVNEKLSLKFRMGLTLSPVSYRLCAVPRL